MRAIVIREFGGPEVLEPADVPTPEPGARELLVRIHATSLNRADLLQRRGNYPPPAGVPRNILGMDVAGIVERLGPGATRFKPGDRLMALVAGGAYAEYITINEDEGIPVPDRMSLNEAAAVPEVFLTAHDALRQLDVQPEEWLLVHAVGSGVGTALLQLARARGVKVIGTARAAWKLERAAGLGLEHGVEANDKWVDRVREIVPDGVNAIADLVGGEYLARDIDAAALRGRILAIGLVAGSRAEIDFRKVLNKRLTIRGTVLRSRSKDEKIEVVRQFASDALALLEEGVINPVIDEVMPMLRAADAHAKLESNDSFGKIVLEW